MKLAFDDRALGDLEGTHHWIAQDSPRVKSRTTPLSTGTRYPFADIVTIAWQMLCARRARRRPSAPIGAPRSIAFDLRLSSSRAGRARRRRRVAATCRMRGMRCRQLPLTCLARYSALAPSLHARGERRKAAPGMIE